MRRLHAMGYLFPVALMTVTACPPPAADDAGSADAARDASVADHATADTGRTDAGAIDSGACTVDSRGFCIRVPQYRDVPWARMGGGTDLIPTLDVDYVCTLDDGATHGFVYLQARATSCNLGCETTVDGAWTSVASTVAPVTAEYDWGGRHNNDTISVHANGKVYRYYHSSIGFGFRACQLPDCTLVYQADGTTLIEDGCTMARTRPQVCVRVADDGSVPALVDTFAPCPGDPNYADAGAGD